jgi:hypothetical protein
MLLIFCLHLVLFFVALAVGVAWDFWSALSFALFLSLTVPLLLYEIDL